MSLDNRRERTDYKWFTLYFHWPFLEAYKTQTVKHETMVQYFLLLPSVCLSVFLSFYTHTHFLSGKETVKHVSLSVIVRHIYAMEISMHEYERKGV